jgi:hypothetical protein
MNWGWVVGLIEGEGCFSVHRQRRGGRIVNRQPSIGVSMTDESIIRQIQEATGMGQVYGPYRIKSGSQMWTWRVSAKNDARQLMTNLYPWMSPRRKGRIAQVMEECYG